MNKKRHTEKGYKRINPTPEGNENLASTVQHELLHFKHPDMKEMNVRKLEKKTVKKMTRTQKERLLDKVR